MAYDYGACLSDGSGLSEFAGRDSADLLARIIFAEAQGEVFFGKQGVAHVIKNRKDKNLAEFGGGTLEGVILHTNAGIADFQGMTTSYARCPDRSSQAWKDSLAIAQNMAAQNNPIGKCHWFVRNDVYTKYSKKIDVNEYYTFERKSSGNFYQLVVEKQVIGNHTFFRVNGY